MVWMVKWEEQPAEKGVEVVEDGGKLTWWW
jgi:hypothetical protein